MTGPFFYRVSFLALLALLFSSAPGDDLPASNPGMEDFLAGAKWEYSGDQKSWSPQPPVVAGGAAAVVWARTSFTAPDPAPWAVLEFTHGLPRYDALEIRLNGGDVPLPEGMIYKTVPGVPAKLLKQGSNDLALKITFEKLSPAEPDQPVPDLTARLQASLNGLKPDRLAMVAGPILGAAGPDWFTVTCRTNMPVPVTLTVQPAAGKGTVIERKSEAGLFHRFRADGLDAKTQWQYSLSVDSPPYRLTGKSRPVRLISGNEPMRFIILGDCRTRTKEWTTVADAVLKAKPEFVGFTGDMTECGRFDWLWQEHFFSPAAEMFATIPLYPIMGNHEENAAVYPLYFHTPAGGPPTPHGSTGVPPVSGSAKATGETPVLPGQGKDWVQDIGPLTLIGFDGQWSQDWEPVKRPWLRKTMEQAKGKFILVLTHYPGWSSAKNGSLDAKTHLPKHWAYRNIREFVAPVMAKTHAAALIVSHEHMYERSELPGGVTQIISGGAGAPLSRNTPEAKEQNPYAKVQDSALHYCVFEIKGDQCVFRALTPAGKEIDTCTWKARKP